jgi:D-glycero-D-manno-heptose 1,7-bisphosphate phosphatase
MTKDETHPPSPSTTHKFKAVFLDRDGVINKMYKGDWVRSWELFVWLPGAKEALALIRKKGLICIVITNQSCVGRGIVTRQAVDDINARMVIEVVAVGGKIDAIYVCPHRPDEGCECRKPGTTNFERAARDFGLRPEEILYIGDSDSDREAAGNFGCAYEMADEKRTLLEIVRRL